MAKTEYKLHFSFPGKGLNCISQIPQGLGGDHVTVLVNEKRADVLLITFSPNVTLPEILHDEFSSSMGFLEAIELTMAEL